MLVVGYSGWLLHQRNGGLAVGVQTVAAESVYCSIFAGVALETETLLIISTLFETKTKVIWIYSEEAPQLPNV